MRHLYFLFFFLIPLFTLNAQVEIKPDSSNFQSKVTIDNVLENNGMKYPSIDGTNGQVLTTDGMGNLTWQNGASDFNSFFAIACSSPMTYNLGATPIISDECGTLYDSGGPGGNYSNNENNGVIISFGGNPNYLYTRIILKTLEIEDNRDTLFIEGIPYFLDLNTPDTLYFDGSTAVTIDFKSDNINTEAGFELMWDRLEYQSGNSVTNMLGFFFNAEQQSVGGGVELDNAWTEVGENSVLLGFGGEASNTRATSVGYKNEASGMSSSAIGDRNGASGSNSNAFGYDNKATANSSSSFGYQNDANMDNSSAFGYQNDAFGLNSIALGYQNLANMVAASALGYDNDATGGNSSAVGYQNQATGDFSNAYGNSNEATAQTSSAFGYTNQAISPQSGAFGYDNTAGSFRANAFGYTNSAVGFQSNAFGYNNTANSDNTSAFGYSNEAEAVNASAFGYTNEASGTNTSVFGYTSSAEASNATALGHQLFVDVYQMTAVGCFNEDPVGSSNSWISTDPVFMVGNGQDIFNRSSALTILKNGRVGIGTSAPSTGLHILSNNSNPFRMESSTTDSWMGFYNSTGYVGYAGIFSGDNDMDFGTGGGNTNGNLNLVTQTLTRVTIDSDGNVGIGELNPQELLHIDGTIQMGTNEKIQDGGTNEISSNSTIIPLSDDNGTNLGRSNRRWSEVWATDGTINTSDRKHKTNIKRLDYGLEEILQLEPVRFRWKNKKERGEKLGLIAQDLLEVLPEVVKTHEWVLTSEEEDAPREKVEVENLGVFYSDIIPVLIHGIQEQQAQIEELEAEVEALKAMNERILALEQQLSNQQTILLEGNTNTDRVQLRQNQPNPFKETTTIEYYLPENLSSATILLSDINGNVLKRIPLNHTGEGSITLQTRNLPVGAYQYTLLVDGKVLKTKQMVLVE